MKKFFAYGLVILTACSQNPPSKTSAETSVSDSSRRSVITAPDSTVHRADRSKLIVPGRSIAHVSLGEKTADVVATLGAPDSSDAAMGKALLTWVSKSDGQKNSIRIFCATNMGAANEASRVEHVRVTSTFFKTKEGVGAGSSKAEMQKAFPELIRPDASYTDGAKATNYIYDDLTRGIAFEINKENSCVGVTVHKPGVHVEDTYIPEFADVKKIGNQ